ncbi:NADH:ubiquinone oxidoreductase, partial [Cryomyces antarcticus]
MTPADNPPSSPLPRGSTLQEELAYYKVQYEQLEAELQDFQASSRELEAELEKDVEASEKRERQLKEKVEGLGFEVDEWKTKYKQAKSEANAAQNTLQKEITTLRDTNRTFQLRLRDIEVANDDFERQARNTTSSLEDLESKYNVSIERGVMLEEEIKIGEQEREALRIETQRLRNELSDLKIEAEITQGKLRLAEATIGRHHDRKPQPLATQHLRNRSQASEASGTTTSSPAIATPPPSKSASSTVSDMTTPPSPPSSEASAGVKVVPSTPLRLKRLSTAPDSRSNTPRLGQSTVKPSRHVRGPSMSTSANNPRLTPAGPRRAPPSTSRPSQPPQEGLTRSGSLYQIRGMMAKMQKLEERLQSAKSKLPAPTSTPPRASPRNKSAMGHNALSNITVRSGRKRPSGNTFTPVQNSTE